MTQLHKGPAAAGAQVFRLSNARGFEVRVSTLGATIMSIRAPDREGRSGPVVLGFEEADDYRSPACIAAGCYLGATIGRYANRIRDARFTLEGREYVLAANEGAKQLHGGPEGFDRRLWTVEAFDGASLRLGLISPDGDQGFPGTLHAMVEMSVLPDENTLVLRYSAVTDRPTHVNLTAHPYFNLDRAGAATIGGHELKVFADAYTPFDEASLPTGEVAGVAGLPIDLRQAARLDGKLHHPALALSRGLDHNYILGAADASGLRKAARLSEARTGRSLEVWTSEPGLQVYTAGYLAELSGSAGEHFGRYAGIALETQHYPDSPNQTSFPSTRLNPGETYRSETQLRFSTLS